MHSLIINVYTRVRRFRDLCFSLEFPWPIFSQHTEDPKKTHMSVKFNRLFMNRLPRLEHCCRTENTYWPLVDFRFQFTMRLAMVPLGSTVRICSCSEIGFTPVRTCLQTHLSWPNIMEFGLNFRPHWQAEYYKCSFLGNQSVVLVIQRSSRCTCTFQLHTDYCIVLERASMAELPHWVGSNYNL